MVNQKKKSFEFKNSSTQNQNAETITKESNKKSASKLIESAIDSKASKKHDSKNTKELIKVISKEEGKNKEMTLPIVITNASAKENVVFRTRVNHVGVDAIVDNRKSYPIKNQRLSTELIPRDSTLNFKKSNSESRINKQRQSAEISTIMLEQLIRSPPSKELPPPPYEEYSYASVEFRPMQLADEGAFSTPINDRTKITDSKPGSQYSYARVDLRPMAVGKQGAVSIPVEDKVLFSHPIDTRAFTNNKNNGVNCDGLKPNDNVKHISVNNDLYAIVDKSAPSESAGVNGEHDLYAVVDKKKLDVESSISRSNANVDLYASVNKTPVTSYKNSTGLSHGNACFETSISDSNNLQSSRENLQDLYAAINYSDKRRTSAEDVLSPTAMPQNFADLSLRNTRRVSDGMLDTQFFGFGKRKHPPPIPKPYVPPDRKWDLPTHAEEPSYISESTRQRLNSFNRNSISTEDMFSSSEYKDIDTKKRIDLLTTSTKPPSLTGLLIEERLAKSQNTEELQELKAFKKQHRRMRSHETIDRNFLQTVHTGAGKLSALSNTRSHSSSSLSTSKDSEDDLLLNDSHSVDLNNSEELPEGWQEVNDGSETYYWHIWTGTIQYERPTRSGTPSTTSRSVSPFSDHSRSSSRAPSVSDPIDEKNTKSSIPSLTSSPRSDTPDKLKQIISFPVHSMGWLDVEEELMSANIIADTVNNCVARLAEERHDLWKTAETWAEGMDIKLILEGETLKLFEPKSKTILHIQPIAKMRVWGVGRVETRDFAYIARDQTTGKHKCHMFRCHGHVSGRSITNALQAICNRVLDEKRKAKERSETPTAKVSDLLKPPLKASSSSAFNEKPYVEQKKCFTAKYVGSVDISKSSGIDIVNKSVAKYSEEPTTNWSSVLVEVTTSEIKTIDCVKQQAVMEHRVRFISFLGVAQDERFGAYIVAVAKDAFQCHVFFCAPHAGTLTRAIEEACKLRFEKMLDGKMHLKNPNHKPKKQTGAEQEQDNQQHQTNAISPKNSMKEKTSNFLSASIAGVFNKLNKKDVKKKEDVTTDVSSLAPGPNEHLVKYYGSVNVDIGTGVETVQSAVGNLVGGEMMVGYLQIQPDCITIWDSQRTALSKRIFDLNTISYCGMTSDRKNFGIIVSRGKGKYTCHVFQEYKPNLGEIVHAIHEVL